MSLCSIVRVDVQAVGLEGLPAAIAAPRMQSAPGQHLAHASAAQRERDELVVHVGDPGLSLASAYRAALEWADDAGRAIA